MKVLLIDIDGTICTDIKNEESHLYPNAEVFDGSLKQINGWYEEGHHITFFTAREEKDRQVTTDWLDKHGFKYHGLIMGKPRCINQDDCYVWIDNRKVMGVTYKGKWGPLVERVAKIKTMD
jgi:uncharacterized HAD superfamily protein